MSRLKRFLGLSLVALGVLAWAAPGHAYKREELAKYEEKAMMAPEWTLKGMDGKTYSLKDYRGKMYVAIQTGSST